MPSPHGRAHDGQAFLWAFDLLELDGEALRPRPLLERKGALRRVLGRISIDNEDAAAGRANPGYLLQRREWIEQVMESITCDDDREAAITIWQR
jgi:ATP-dependent DNA ligase